MMNKLFPWFILILFSCSVPKRRLERFIKRNPQLIKVDTITVIDTFRVTIPSVRIDTFVRYDKLRDTVYFQKDFVKIKLFEVNDTVYIEAKTDTIFKDVIRFVNVPCKNIEIITDDSFKKHFILISLMLLFLGVVLFLLLRQKKPP